MRAIVFLAGFLCACSGAGGVGEPTEEACADGVLLVEGPATRVMARYPEATPPERLLEHRTSPGMLVTPEGYGWVSFLPQAAIPAGSRVSIETHDYASGDALCPLEFAVERP